MRLIFHRCRRRRWLFRERRLCYEWNGSHAYFFSGLVMFVVLGYVFYFEPEMVIPFVVVFNSFAELYVSLAYTKILNPNLSLPKLIITNIKKSPSQIHGIFQAAKSEIFSIRQSKMKTDSLFLSHWFLLDTVMH